MIESVEQEPLGQRSSLIEVPLGSDPQEEFKGKINQVSESTLNQDLIFRGIENEERAREFISFAQHLLPHLPADEKIGFAKDPLRFVSSTFGFRGLTPEKYARLREDKIYPPESGHFGSRGVYFSNSPYDAFTYQNKGTVAVVPVENLITIEGRGFHEVGSDVYKAHTQAYMDALPSTATSRERSDALYSADEGLDLLEVASRDHPTMRNIVARQSQPIEVTRVFLTWRNGGFSEEQSIQLAA